MKNGEFSTLDLTFTCSAKKVSAEKNGWLLCYEMDNNTKILSRYTVVLIRERDIIVHSNSNFQ
jgi:hypothetical protein